MSQAFTRRRFLRDGSGAMLGLAASALPAAADPRPVSPNEKITLGFIGVGGRGNADLDTFMRNPDVQVAAICDVYRPHLDAALRKVGSHATGYHDFRSLLERKDLDAVVIATPPHWHALITVAACQAGKDVYVEKPMTLYPGEIAPVVKAARENKRVTQVGTQIHATENYRRVVEIVRSGALGKITLVRNVLFLNESPKAMPDAAGGDPPADLDWELWQGPAAASPYHPDKVQNGFYRYFQAYVGSWLHEMGPHIVDLPVWALELGPPKSASAVGGRFALQDAGDIPDTMEVTWEYPGLLMTWHHSNVNAYPFHWLSDPPGGRRIAVVFQGTNGTLVTDYDRHESIGDNGRPQDTGRITPLPPSPGHDREFLDGIKSRQLPSCNVAYHANVHAALNLGQLSYRVGRKVVWDTAAQRVVNDREADRLALPAYRKPWTLPR